MINIALFDAKPYDRQSFDAIKDNYDVKIKYFETKLNEDTAKLANGFDVVCAFVNDDLDQACIDKLYELNVKLIAMRCAGYNNVDFKSAYEKINIVRVPAYSPYAVAEHAFALINTINRKIHRAFNRTRENNFNISGLTGFDLHGKTIGIIGMGKIGRIVKDIALGYGMKVLAFDMYPQELENVKFTDLNDIYKQSDVISLHCPLTEETHHIINAESIEKMKNGVMIINTSRGGLVDANALIEGIKSKKIGSAGLDVYEEEAEYFFENFSDEVITDDTLARLLSFNNVLVTSHQAFLTNEALENIAQTTMENIEDFFNDKPLKNEICYQCEQFGDCKKNENERCF